MECTFCKENIKPGTGLIYVKKEGAVFYFCSKKCERNLLNLRRNPAKLKWIKKEEKIKREKEEVIEKKRERKTKDKTKTRKRRERQKVKKSE